MQMQMTCADLAGNPFVTTIDDTYISKDQLWTCYEELLQKLKDLFVNHGAIVTDCHRLNLRLCMVD